MIMRVKLMFVGGQARPAKPGEATVPAITDCLYL